jgi:GT2 family glycosyltransferase
VFLVLPSKLKMVHLVTTNRSEALVAEAEVERSCAERIAALKSAHERQIAELESAHAKRIAVLKSAHERQIAELDGAHAKLMAEIEVTVLLRVVAQLRNLKRSLRTKSKHYRVKLSAFLRHPQNSFKRKIFRKTRMSGRREPDAWQASEPGNLLTYLHARHPNVDLGAIVTGKGYIERFGGKGVVLSGGDVAGIPELRSLVMRIWSLAGSDPAAASPTVSIIVPVYNQLVHTLVCLLSILSQPTTFSYEILVTDDASSDGTQDALGKVAGRIRYIRNQKNLGFLRSCNAAAACARGEYLFFLNNDTQVLPRTIDVLVELARARPDAGMVGSKLIYPDGRLQEAGGIIWNDASAWNFGREQNPGDPAYNYVRDVDYISGTAILISRKLWKELGGFDELYVPAYCEDSDLALRIHRCGLKVLYQPLSEVVHYEGVSHGADVNSGGKAYQIRNIRHLQERWLPTLEQSHFPNGTRVIRARDRAFSRPILLIVDHYIPEPDRDAGSRTMLEFMRAFVDLGFVVKFLPQNGYHNPTYAPMFEQMGVEILSGLSRQQRLEWLQANGPEIDHVLLSRPTVAPDYISELRHLTKARLGYYGHDLHFARMQQEAQVIGNCGQDAAAAAMAQTERSIWRQVDVVLYPSQEEADTVRALEPIANARAVPPYCFEDGIVRDQPPANHSIVFVAGFGHTPNIDAASWLVTEILPLIRTRLPDTTLSLIGSNPSERVKALISDHVEVTGFLTNEELARRYATARLAVVPLRFGAGVKLKLLEAMWFGLPTVTTPVGVQGLPEIADIVPVCSEAQAFADAAIKLLTDDAAWTRRSAAGARYVERQFSPRALRASLVEAFLGPGNNGVEAARAP